MSRNNAQQDPLTGRVVNATLVLHGTVSEPFYRKDGPRVYDDLFNRFTTPVKTDCSFLIFVFVFIQLKSIVDLLMINVSFFRM